MCSLSSERERVYLFQYKFDLDFVITIITSS